MFFNDGDDNWNSTANLCVYEKQPLIGVVHELIVEFCDDILTIFPFIVKVYHPKHFLSIAWAGTRGHRVAVVCPSIFVQHSHEH